MKILVSTQEGYTKDKSPVNKKRYHDRGMHFSFSGPDAPRKAVKAMMEKWGVTKEEL